MSSGGAGADVRAWIDATWHPDLTVRAWWRALADAGLAFPTWPQGLGGLGASAAGARDIARGLADRRVIGPPAGVGQSLGAPTLLVHATPDQQQALVPGLADGTECWCQLFSEPGAGSDLAGLQTRAERDGDEWVITGQKVWNSAAHLSDRGLLLARTDPDAPKHDGISYFVIDMDQPGIEVRPLRQMNGDAEFCEVFLTEARVSHDRLIGGRGNGWRVARTTLAFERTNVARSGARGGITVMPGTRAGQLDRCVGEVIADAANAPRAAVSGFVIGNQALSRFRTSTEINRITALRARAAAAAGQPGPEASTGKLAMSNIARASRELAFSLMGAEGMLAEDDAPLDGAAHRVALASFGASMGGGTDEIQRNVIGERTLGLPKEPTDD